MTEDQNLDVTNESSDRPRNQVENDHERGQESISIPGSGTQLCGARITHKHASRAEIARTSPSSVEAETERLLNDDAVSEAFVLTTCHRVELYAITADTVGEKHSRWNYITANPSSIRMQGPACLRHLLRVAAGLESVVLGEDEILGQLEDAYETARQAGGIGQVLGPAVRKAIDVGKRARTETDINAGVRSIGGAAVQLLDRECTLEGQTALVIGAGTMGATVIDRFARASTDHIIVANRTPERGESVIGERQLDATVVDLASLPEAFECADVVVTATASPDPLIDVDIAADTGRTSVVDLAQLSDVDPAVYSLPNVTVYTLQDLETVTTAATERRQAAVRAVQTIISEELDTLQRTYAHSRVEPVVRQLHVDADRLKRRKLEDLNAKLTSPTEDEQAAIENLADSILSELLAAPTERLKQAAERDEWAIAHTAIDLFDLDIDDNIPETDNRADGGYRTNTFIGRNDE